MYVMILGRSNCPYCDKAKELAELKNLRYKYMDILAKGFTKEHLAVYVGQEVDTVPQIFIHTKSGGTIHVGGYDDFLDFVSNM